MSRRVIAGVLTFAVLGVILAIGARSPSARTGGAQDAATDPSGTPEARLRRFLDDARAGDVAGYLDAYAEPLRSRVAREADEAGRTAFADSLRRAAVARKGHAFYAPEPDGPDAVRIVVESVYPDRNERQSYRLERGPDGWRIAGVESVRGREPTARFGAPATYRDPEGIPVQGIEPPESSEDPGL
jgi:hypothetical protein